MVVGSSLAQFVINILKRHPTVLSRPLIYWELVLTLLPSQLGGGNIGQILSKMLPTSLVYVLALVVLFFASSLTLKKGLHKWHMENEKFADEAEARAKTKSTTSREGDESLFHTTNHIFSSPKRDSSAVVVEERMGRKTFEIATRTSSTRSWQQYTPSLLDQLHGSFRESLEIYTDKDGTHKLQLPIPHLITIAIMWVSCTCLSVGRTLVGQCTPPYLALLGLIYFPILCAHYVFVKLNRQPPSTVITILSTKTTLDQHDIERW
jgi:hypothetical protein